MKKILKIFTVFLCLLAITLSLSMPFAVNADMGPKASVHIQFENMGDELCYGTLLSKHESTGPNSVWDGNEEHIYNYNLDIDIWRAFAEYEDSDGYYYLQTGWCVSETKEIAWTYYPPNPFKILLYYPETDRFVVSGIYEKYAFDTYYTVDMSGFDMGSVELNKELSNNDRLTAYKTYNFLREFGSLSIRIVLTILIELAVALIFGFKKKKQIMLLICVNTLTQIILNLLLNCAMYNSEFGLIFLYFVSEMAVFVIEAFLYCKLMGKSDAKKTKLYCIIYAIVANAASFGAGLILADMFPGIF